MLDNTLCKQTYERTLYKDTKRNSIILASNHIPKDIHVKYHIYVCDLYSYPTFYLYTSLHIFLLILLETVMDKGGQAQASGIRSGA